MLGALFAFQFDVYSPVVAVFELDRFVGCLVEVAIITRDVRSYRRRCCHLQTVDLSMPGHLRFVGIRPTANITAEITTGQWPMFRLNMGT